MITGRQTIHAQHTSHFCTNMCKRLTLLALRRPRMRLSRTLETSVSRGCDWSNIFRRHSTVLLQHKRAQRNEEEALSFPFFSAFGEKNSENLPISQTSNLSRRGADGRTCLLKGQEVTATGEPIVKIEISEYPKRGLADKHLKKR